MISAHRDDARMRAKSVWPTPSFLPSCSASLRKSTCMLTTSVIPLEIQAIRLTQRPVRCAGSAYLSGEPADMQLWRSRFFTDTARKTADDHAKCNYMQQHERSYGQG